MVKPILPEITAGDEELLHYEMVRRLFGWKDNKTIRRYVGLHLLRRVRIGNGRRDFRITAESAKRLREHMLACADEADYLTKARMQTMREAQGKPATETASAEVLIDPAQVIAQFNEGRRAQRAARFVRVRGI